MLRYFLVLAVNSVPSTIDNLEGKGLVRRQRSEEDRRVVRVELTDSGRQVSQSLLDVNMKLFRSMLGAQRLRRFRGTVTAAVDLPSTEQELATLTEAQHARVLAHAASARQAASDWLREQDARLGLTWSDSWSTHVASPAKLYQIGPIAL